MLDLHITEFYNDTGRIFNRLYSSFPRLITIWLDEISGPDTVDEYGMHSDRHMACYSTMLWLQEEGYLRYSDIEKEDGFNHCCLTQKGYGLMSGIILENETGYRPIDRIRAALKEKSSTLMEEAVTDILARGSR